MVSQMEHDIAMTGMKFDDYLKHIKKTKEELTKEWHEPAEKRAKMNLIIDAVAKAENLVPSDDEIAGEVKKIMEQYKDMKDVDEVNVQAYVASVLTNKKVFEFFEKQ
jgi:trigger factor